MGLLSEVGSDGRKVEIREEIERGYREGTCHSTPTPWVHDVVAPSSTFTAAKTPQRAVNVLKRCQPFNENNSHEWTAA